MKVYINERAVKQFLLEKRWSGRDLARKLQVAPSTVSRMRRNERSVSGYVMKRLVDITNGYLTSDELFTYQPTAQSPLDSKSVVGSFFMSNTNQGVGG